MKVKVFQEGGQMAPAAAPQASPEDQLAALAQQLVEMLMQQIGDPQAVMAVLQMAAEMVQGAAQPVGQPEQGAEFMRCGGKIKKKAKKACGGKMSK